MLNTYFRRAILVCVAVGVPASAHDSWLEPTSFHPAKTEPLPITFFVGHHGEQRATKLISRPKWLSSMRLHAPGSNIDLLTSEAFSRTGRVPLQSSGAHMISLATSGFKHQMKPADFPAYMNEEGLAGAKAAWARSPVRGRNVQEEYRRYAKAIVQVGASEIDRHVTQRLGHRLEIVPSVNPYRLRAGAPLTATIWHMGSPLRGALVTLGSLDRPKEALLEARSDAGGKVSFQMPDSGRWMMNVVWSIPSQKPGVDFETSFSSATFSAPRHL
jgi:uncharacterized GH25 family protein